MKNYKLYEPDVFNSFRELLKKALLRGEEKAAFKYRHKNNITEISYKQFDHEVKRLAKALCDLKLDSVHIAIVGDNSYRWINIFLSLLTTRATAVPVDKELPEEQMLNVLDSSDSEIVFYSDSFEEFIKNNADNFALSK